jgi:hypothetical protein
MHSSRIVTPVIPSENDFHHPFDVVYQAAKNQDHATLKNLVVIDVRKVFHTPASLLAYQGNEKAVILLIHYGANVHQAATGAAMGRKYELADLLHKRFGANINKIAMGVAIAGDYDYLNELFTQYDEENNGINKELIAFALAINGDFAYAEKICELHALTAESKKLFFSHIAMGAMINGNRGYALKLYHEHEFEMDDLLVGAEIVGNMADVEVLVQAVVIEENVSRILAKCAANSANKEYCIKLCKNEKWNTSAAYRRSIIEGIKQGCYASGNLKLLEELKEDSWDLPQFDADPGMLITFAFDSLSGLKDSKSFIKGAIVCGYFNFCITNLQKNKSFLHSGILHFLFEKNPRLMFLALNHLDFHYPSYVYNDICQHAYINSENRKDNFFKIFAEGLAETNLYSTPAIALHQFSFINDYAFLNALKNSEHLPSYIREIIPNAIRINQCMKKYDLDFDQAQAFLNYDELRKFLLLVTPFNNAGATDAGAHIPAEVVLRIMMSFSRLSFEATRDLYNKVNLAFNKSLLACDMEKYENESWMNKYHSERAASFFQASQKVNNRASLKALIHYQNDLFAGVKKPELDSNSNSNSNCRLKSNTNSSSNSNSASHKPKHEQALVGGVKDKYYEIINKHSLRLR